MTDEESRPLRERVLRGGAFLVLRDGAGVAIGGVGIIVLTRLIGPSAFGTYAAALAVYIFFYNLFQWGIPVYLIRKLGAITKEDCHLGFTLLLLLGSFLMALALIGSGLVQTATHIHDIRLVEIAIFAALFLDLTELIPLAILERELDYRRVAKYELIAQTANYAVALPLAILGRGVWAPVAGWWTQKLLEALLFYRAAHYRPRLRWNTQDAKDMLGYGAGYSTSIWIYQLRSLVNPVVVGRYLGAAAVGVVALAIRLVENLSFVKQATFRLSISALARVQTSADRLRAATSEGMALQMLAFGPLLLVFALTGNWIVPRVFGPAWDRTLTVYPFIALGYLTNALFNLHASVLYVLRRNWQVTAFNLLHVALFAGAAAVLVRSAGLIGYGLAEVVAMGAYLLLHWVIVKETGTPDYKFAFTWWVCFSVPLFWRQLGYPALSPLLVLLLPYSRKRLMAYGSEIRRIMRARPGSAAPSQVVD